MRKAKMKILCIFAAVAAIDLAFSPGVAEATFTYGGGTYSQDFDTLITTGTNQTWTNDSTLDGWYLYRQPAPGTAIAAYDAGDGGNNTGSFKSFGTGTSTERALGGVGSNSTYFGSPSSGAVAGWIAFGLLNDTGGTISSVDIEYDGEQWRNAGNVPTQTMVFEYGLGATFETVASWLAPGAAFNFTSPITGTPATGLDGNAAANRVADIGSTIASLTVDPGQVLWFRWIENNDTNNDHGLAIDNFSFSATLNVVPELPTFYTFGGLIGAYGLYAVSALLIKRRAAAQSSSL